MPNGGDWHYPVSKWEGNVFIIVSDTGVGLPEEVKPKLFTPMLTTKSKGQGFGLAVSVWLLLSLLLKESMAL